MGIVITPQMKLVAGAALGGLVAGGLAERFTSPPAIRAAKEHQAWSKLHDSFLAQHPAPADTRVTVVSKPAWSHAAVVGGIGAFAALGGVAALIYANRAVPPVPQLATAGTALLAAGLGTVGGVAGSWALR